jgi:hypoxanthine phosphoribosyltransferase
MKRLGKVIITEEQIQKKVKELARQIDRDYGGPIILVGILKGAYPFLADLGRALKTPVQVDFIGISSYGISSVSSGEVKITYDLGMPLEGKDVLVVEDIVDSGVSLKYLLEILGKRKPRSLKICALLDKPSRRKVEIPLHYKGFEIPDEFVVGYGMDFAENYRNLPFVAVLEEG